MHLKCVRVRACLCTYQCVLVLPLVPAPLRLEPVCVLPHVPEHDLPVDAATRDDVRVGRAEAKRVDVIGGFQQQLRLINVAVGRFGKHRT